MVANSEAVGAAGIAVAAPGAVAGGPEVVAAPQSLDNM